jgi:hypothetical protein
MKLRYSVIPLLFLVQALSAPRVATADKLTFPDGTTVEGIVQKIEKGQVTIAVGKETRVFDVLAVEDIDFDTPHLAAGTPRLPLEHFLANIEAQEMVGHFRDVEESASAIRKLIDETKKEWTPRKTISSGEMARWEATKEGFRKPLSRYQEVLNDLYFHMLGKVDQYNLLMKEADSVRVGAKGWFQAGSSLIPSDMEKLPLKKYVPANWYDTIYYDGYDMGYRDAFEKYRDRPFSTRD